MWLEEPQEGGKGSKGDSGDGREISRRFRSSHGFRSDGFEFRKVGGCMFDFITEAKDEVKQNLSEE